MIKERKDERLKELKLLTPCVLIPSLVFYGYKESMNNWAYLMEKHEKKLKSLAVQQDRPLLVANNVLKLIDVDIPVPQYVIDTLSLGPKNPVLDTFDKNMVLAEVDLLLEFCEPKDVSEDTKNEIETATGAYIKGVSSKIQIRM